MCLILFAWQAHPRYPLVVAANRDEFHQRPTATASFWKEPGGVLAGRDLEAGGTWLGVNRGGRFAAITNYREPHSPAASGGPSRGHLVSNYLLANERPLAHARGLGGTADAYSGFNLLLGMPGELAYLSNRDGPAVALEAGVHGLSNHLLNTEWPKVPSGRERLNDLLTAPRLEPEDHLELLADRRVTPGEFPRDLENSLVGEQLASHYFIVSPVYGTRSSTVVLYGDDGQVRFVERQYHPDGTPTHTTDHQFHL